MRPALKRLLKWLVRLCLVLLVFIILFLTIPGIEFAWQFPADAETPWLLLSRSNTRDIGFDIRQVRLGKFQAGLVFIDKSFPISTAPWSGTHWEDGTFWYIGDHWMFSAGLESEKIPAFIYGTP